MEIGSTVGIHHNPYLRNRPEDFLTLVLISMLCLNRGYLRSTVKATVAFDSHSNFGFSQVAVAPAPALTGLSLTVTAGQGALFPAAPFNCTVWPNGVAPLAANAEIIRVTGIVGDTLTIVRAQEGTAARAIVVGDQIANTTSVKVFTDIEASIITGISAGAAVAAAPQVVFSNSNGVSFGAAGQTITASVRTNYAGTNGAITGGSITVNTNGVSVNLPAYLTTAMASNRGSDFVQATAAFAGTNASGTINSTGISVSVAAVAGQSTQPVAASAANGSFQFSTVSFSNANGVSFVTSAGSAIAASVQTNYQTPGAYLTTALASDAGSRFVNTSAGLNLTNISATFNSNSISLSVAAAAGQSIQPVAASAANGSFLFSTVNFSDANGVSFITSAGSAIAASVQTNYLTTAMASNRGSDFVQATAVFAGTNASGTINSTGISVSVADPGANGVTLSQFENSPYIASLTRAFLANGVFHAVAFVMPQPISIGFIRMPVVMSTNSTTRSVTASSMNASVEVYSSFQVLMYKMNTGAKSQSLTLVTSSQDVWTMRQSLSLGADGTSGSYTQGISGFVEGVATNRTTQYTIANANSYSFTTQQIVTEWTGTRFLDIGFGNSLSAGNYWMLVGMSTGSSANSTGISAASNCRVGFSQSYAISQANSSFMKMGTNESVGLNCGSFLTAGAVTTAEFPLSAISVIADNLRPYFQMIRKA